MPLKEIIQTLKQKRESLGLTIEDVSRQTKMNSTVIANIENGEVDKMSAVYLKGFLKIYISFLGLEKDLIAALDNEFKKKEIHPAMKKPEVPPSPSTPFLTGSRLFFKEYKTAIGVLIVLIAAGWVAVKGTQVLFKHLRAAQKKTGVSVRLPARSIAVSRSASGSEIKMKKSTEIRVTLRARKECFLRLRKDGIVIFDGIVPRGTARTWIAQKDIEMSINDRSAVEIEVNGESLPLGKRKHSIKSLKITLDRITIQ